MYPGDKFQERGHRARVFTIVSVHPEHCVLTFTGGSRRRGEGPRTVSVFHRTLRRHFVWLGAAPAY